MKTTARLVVVAVAFWLTTPCEAAADDVSAEQLALIKRAEQARVRVVGRIRPAVVSVFGNNRRGGGSGVLFDASGLALTNHHVVAAAGVEGWAGLDDGKLYRWKLIGTDPGGDVAVIRLAGKKAFPFAPLGLSDDVRPGEWVLALGNPFTLAEDYAPTVTLGIVSGVRRYQRGAGRNMLVYGNCIQVDSSINPGNSGGPLFNRKGEVVGINGRASFKERGRVNVGAGYAISMRQIRNFIPELAATKIARHGTLDAQFSNRRAGVICDAVNLDSPAAKAGLRLGDKLLRFDGEAIRNANQFTNLISMLPEGWPVELLVERDGKPHTIRVRLDPLNYGAAPNVPMRKGKKPVRKPRGARLDLANAGLVRNVAVNRELCGHVLAKWQRHTGVSGSAKLRVFQIRDDLYRGRKKVGTQRLTIASDGRFRVEVDHDGERRTFTYDGSQKEEAVRLMLRDPFAVQAAALSGVLSAKRLPPLYSAAEIEACDKSQNERAYRLRLLPASKGGRDAYVWLSQFDKSGRESVRLLKTGIHTEGDRARPCVTYADWKRVAGVALPHRRRLVVGLAETPILELRTQSCQSVKNWPTRNR
ncbi:MAG: S1C family serine protease [Planctomycetaceae bacterium]